MATGSLTISIDLELAWGNWDNLEARHVHHVGRSERTIVGRLVEIFDRYEVPATWAFVAALLDRDSARDRPGDERLWFAPDVIDTIRSGRVSHDFGSHGGRHRYFDQMSEEEAGQDLAFAREVHQRHGLPFRSFVFPRNKVGKTHLLKQYGLQVFRGEDRAWHQRVRSRMPQAGRVANLVDKMLPIAPEPVEPRAEDGLVNLPGSMLFLGREGVRRYASPGIVATKLQKGLAAAHATGGVFHLWFHPSNFWYETDRQFGIFERFAATVAEQAGRGDILVKPMADFA